MNPFRVARDYVAKGETSEDRETRRDQVTFVSATAIAVPILIVGSVSIGGREFVLPWILMFALAGVAGCAWRWRLELGRALPLPTFSSGN